MADRSTRNLKRAELEAEVRRLRRRERLFEEAARFTHAGYFEWNTETGQLQSWSLNFARILDLSIDQDLDPDQVWEVLINRIHPDDKERYVAVFEETQDYHQLKIEFRIIGADGKNRFLRQVGIKNTTAETGESCLLGMLQDISAQMIDEADPNFSDSLALQVERITDIGSFIYDDFDDKYLYASPGCARIHGVTDVEFMKDVNSVEDDLLDVHEEDRDRVEKIYNEFYKSGKDCSVEYRIILPDGKFRWVKELLAAQLLQADGNVALSRGVIQDITEQKTIELELRQAKQNLEVLVNERTRELASTVSQLEEEIEEREKISAELEFLANHDPLTGLPSLRLCKDRLERALAEARRNRHLVAVLFLDLDGFKEVNDRYGHETGDSVLKMTASRIRAEIRETDTVARIGGDEFLVILSGLPDLSVVERVASSLIQQVSQPINIDQIELAIGTSIGIALYPDDATDSEALIRIADQAMYMIKHSGKNSFGFLQPRKLN